MQKKKPGLIPVPGAASVTDLEEDRLLRAIIADPKADAPRLAFAAYLEKRGDARGRFIRDQVLASAKKTAAAAKKTHREEAKALLDAHWGDWVSASLSKEGTTTERGFFTHLAFDPAKRFFDTEAARLAGSPLFALLPLHPPESPGAVFNIMARLPRLGCLGKLDWSGMVSEEEDEESKQTPVALVLMASPHLAGLTELRLADCALLDGSLQAIARNPAAASLKVLDLGSDGVANGFGTMGARELSRSPHLAGLVKLDISEAPGVGDSGVLAIIEATATLPKLADLNIQGTDLSDAGALRISACPGLARFSRLRIGRWAYQDTPLGDPACKALLESPHLEKIERLEIALTPEPDTARAMKKRWGKRLVLGKRKVSGLG